MKIVYLFSLFLLGFLDSFSQVRPYKASVYDTTLTGYYFLSSAKFSSPKGYNGNIILDAKGNAIYYRQLPLGYNAIDFKLQPDGRMSYFFVGYFFIADSTFAMVDTLTARNGYNTDAHELQILPNGHYLLLADEVVKMDLSSYQYFKGKYGSASANVICGVIQELDANKNVVFEWHAKDHFLFTDVDKFYLKDTLNVDWTHCNALELDQDGNILLSVRHFNEITKINRSDSSIMWRFGGKRNQFTFLSDTLPFWGQHDCRRIDNGHITLFDNGWHLYPHSARALEYEMDELNKTADLKWSYIYDSLMFSMATGNVQRIGNTSNTLVDFGATTLNNVTFTVVDSAGSKLFELAFDDTLYSYRSFYYPTLPWKLNRPVLTCFDSLGVTYLDAGPVFDNNYLWNDGSTARVIAVTQPDTFYVWVHYGEGIISSERWIVTNVNDACLVSWVSENDLKDGLKVFPDPVIEKLNISYNLEGFQQVTVSVTDIFGRVVVEWKSTNEAPGNHLMSLDVSNISCGIYFLRVNEKQVKFIKAE